MGSDAKVDRIMARQHGAISRRQALEAGLTDRRIERQRRARRWLVPVRGVYCVAGAPETWQQRAMVACLAGPAGTVASHLTAAALYGLVDPPRTPHVTVPVGANGGNGTATVHWANPGRPDICVVGAIPATRPARTLVDCAALLRLDRLCELVDAAVCRRLTTPSKLRAAAARASRAPGRKGLPLLEEALRVWTPGPLPGSPAEMRLVRHLVKWGLPVPHRQYELFDEAGVFVARMDVALANYRTGFEYEGEESHGPRRWEADDERQERIEALGWQVIPVDRFDLRPSSTRLRDLVAELLGGAAA